MLSLLDWIVQLVMKEGIATPKTIIFCDTMYSVASVANYLKMKLGRLVLSTPTHLQAQKTLSSRYISFSYPGQIQGKNCKFSENQWIKEDCDSNISIKHGCQFS